MRLSRRLEALEAMETPFDYGRPFLWFEGQPLAKALADAGLSLDDKPLQAIRLCGVRPGETKPRHDPVFEQDRVLLD